jgi:hypothetical protein
VGFARFTPPQSVDEAFNAEAQSAEKSKTAAKKIEFSASASLR